MDVAFACPECGTLVSIQGVAPGRQVQCGFCGRFVEVPYLPRVSEPAWRRRRFGRPWWFVWALAGVGMASAAVVLLSLVKLLEHREFTESRRAIVQLAASAEDQERTGNTARALLEIDSAIGLCERDQERHGELLEGLEKTRQTLARRDADAVFERLQAQTSALPLGEWLNLKARVETDRDLAPLRPVVAAALAARLTENVEADLASARRELDAGRAAAAIDRCDAAAGLIAQLPAAARAGHRAAAESLVTNAVAQRGVLVDPPLGRFVAGTAAEYTTGLLATIVTALKSKGYAPQVDSSPWRSSWSAAPYRMVLEVNETLEGNYMSSENRLTRIEALLRLSLNGKEFWRATPTARTTVPLPRLPAYLSARVALSPERIEEFEHLLYENARGQIHEKLAFALNNLPQCAGLPH